MVDETQQGRENYQSPEEEIRALRERIAIKEQELIESRGQQNERIPPRDEIVSQEIREYVAQPQRGIPDASRELSQGQIHTTRTELESEEHDTQMAKLNQMIETKGIKNAVAVVTKMGNPHLEDDFHRYLVQRIKKGLPNEPLKEKGPLWKVLNMTLYEITLPESQDKNQERPIKELISSMEQLYSGILSASSSDYAIHYTFEIAISNDSDEIILYAAVPDNKKDLFEKQLLSLFPYAELSEQKNDYNVFIDGGVSLGARGKFTKHGIFPLKMYDEFDQDPFSVILNTFSKLTKEGEGAAIQFVLSPQGGYITSTYKEIVKKVEKGMSFHDALKAPETIAGELAFEAKKILFGGSSSGNKNLESGMRPKTDSITIEQIKNKTTSRVVPTDIRIVASAQTEERAHDILSHLASAFNQFENVNGNKLTFSSEKKSNLNDFFKMFSFREYAAKYALPLSLRELSTLMHFPVSGTATSPQFRQSRAKSAAAPVTLPQEGTLLGVNDYRGVKTNVYLTKEDRLRHFYCIGQTGTGKTTLLKNMIIQDIEQGEGVCMIDPHGTDIQDILGAVPDSRRDDVIYFDPSHLEHVMALNMLEYDERYPEQKTFVINELFSIFQKLYGANPESMGPMFEQYFRNATALVLEDPESGSTLLDVSRVLADQKFRAYKLSGCNNPVVYQFWMEIAGKAGGESSLANIVPYITSKFDVFTSNDYMRPIIGQQKSTFNFRQIMDERKILLVNLAKGRLGDINSNLIGLILVGKILMAALSRVDMVGRGDIAPFYLYIDEFQNVTTDSISTILSEARKYKLSLTVAHQFIAQLDQKIRDAVFGNVGSLAALRVGSEDADFLEKQFSPVFTASDLINIENRSAYVRMLANGEPQKPFSISVNPPKEVNQAHADELRTLSYTRYGRPREEVENEMRERYATDGYLPKKEETPALSQEFPPASPPPSTFPQPPTSPSTPAPVSTPPSVSPRKQASPSPTHTQTTDEDDLVLG
jgi:hypothetical protein